MQKRLFRFLFPVPFVAFLLFLYACESDITKKISFVGRDPSWELSPFDGMTSTINAYLNAAIQALEKQMKDQVEVVDICSSSLFSLLDEGKVAGVLASIPENAQNLAKYAFSPPFLLTGPVLVVQAHSKIKSFDDLGRTTIGVYAFDDSIQYIQKSPQVIIKTYDRIPILLEDLASGEIGAGAVPILHAEMLVNSQFKGVLQVLYPPLSNNGIRLIVLKKNLLHFEEKSFEALTALQSKQVLSALKKKFLCDCCTP